MRIARVPEPILWNYVMKEFHTILSNPRGYFKWRSVVING